MKRLGGYALSILLLASLLLNGYFVLSKQKESTVVDVHDGDTFTLGDGQRVRLLGADAPETERCGAEEAKTLLESLVLGKQIQITEEKRDTYGRRMGLVHVGTTLVNEQMLKQGFARPDYTASSKSEALKAAYKEATEAKRGIHSSLCKNISPTPPSPSCTIKGNIDKATYTHYYHLPTCRHYNQIVLDADMGEQFFCSETDAKTAGFTIAPDCLR
jgi:endonuclease YncB( thermonuclease family)